MREPKSCKSLTDGMQIRFVNNNNNNNNNNNIVDAINFTQVAWKSQ